MRLLVYSASYATRIGQELLVHTLGPHDQFKCSSQAVHCTQKWEMQAG